MGSSQSTGASTSDQTLYDSYVESEFSDLSGKVVAITGTSPDSIGFYLARAAVVKNAKHVLLLNRPSERAVKAEEQLKEVCSSNTTIRTIPTDLLSFDSVRKASAELIQIADDNGGLDVLACNAGIMAFSDTRSSDGYDVQMQSNQLSHYLMTQLCMASLDKAASSRGEARIVYHSSKARYGNDLKSKYFDTCAPGTLGGDGSATSMAPWARYHQTKLANSAFAMALHDKLQERDTATGITMTTTTTTAVKALSCEPGYAKSNLQSTAERGGMLLAISEWLVPRIGAIQSLADGSLGIGMCCFSPNANSGDFYMPSSKGGMVGKPKKSIAGGVPVKSGDEKETTSEANKKVVMEACEKIFGPIF